MLVLTWRSSYADTVGEGVKKNWQELLPMYVEIPVQSTARDFHTSLPYRRTSPLVKRFPESCNSLLEDCTHTKKDSVISGAVLFKEKTICALSVHAQVSFMSSQATLHQGRVNLCIIQT